MSSAEGDQSEYKSAEVSAMRTRPESRSTRKYSVTGPAA